MPRTIVIDESVFDRINRGNATVAEVLSKMHHFENCEFWVTRELYDRMRTNADERLLSDLGVRWHLTDSYFDRDPGMRGHVNRLPHGTWRTAALVIERARELRKDVQLMTTYQEFADEFNRYYGNVVKETPRIARPGRPEGVNRFGTGYDYNQARRLLGLKPLNITNDGKIVVTDKAVARRGPEVEPINEMGPSAVAQAKFNGVEVGLRILNYGMEKINDHIQRKRYDEAWAKLEPAVRQQLDYDPTRGVLILAVYSIRQKVGAENESPLQHLPEFQYIVPAYGYTKEDALANLRSTPQLRPAGPAEMSSNEIVWVPPKQAVDVKKLRVPFPSLGVGTFVEGRPKLLQVRWKGRSGFDDDGSTTLSVPARLKPKFLILRPPDEIQWFWNGSHHAKELDINYEPPKQISVYVTREDFLFVPFIDVDGTNACMVVAADNDTEQLFQNTSQTKDNLNQLGSYEMQRVRWVAQDDLLVERWFQQESSRGWSAPPRLGSGRHIVRAPAPTAVPHGIRVPPKLRAVPHPGRQRAAV
jgi:hypothetical protein